MENTEQDFTIESLGTTENTGQTWSEQNDILRDHFYKYGDDCTKPRDVKHYLYAQNHEQAYTADEMAIALDEMGYLVEFLDEKDAIRISHTREIASKEFDTLTEYLEKFAGNAGWYYDGWEALCVKTQNEVKTLH